MLLIVGILVLDAVMYVCGMLLFLWITEYRPKAVEDIAVVSAKNPRGTGVISDSTLTLLTWNLGYGGLGAEVDFVDIDPVTHNLDPNQIEDKLTPNTRAVIPVHLYGQPCEMDEIMALSRKHNFAVVEDAAHAIGAEYKGKKVGTIGATGCFSFHEQKNISTLGEGGIVLTNDDEIFERISLYRSHCTRVHGVSTKYCSLDTEKFPIGKKFWWQDFDDCGYNFRMTDIQAAVGIEQLKKLDHLNQNRIDNAAYISQGLSGVPGLTLPVVPSYDKHVFHLYPVMINAKEFGMTK